LSLPSHLAQFNLHERESIVADGTRRVKQVLDKLLSNAFKFTPRSPGQASSLLACFLL